MLQNPAHSGGGGKFVNEGATVAPMPPISKKIYTRVIYENRLGWRILKMTFQIIHPLRRM